MSYEFLEVSVADKIATVILNRPDKRNALSITVRDELDTCFGELADDKNVSVVLLLTNGPVYCAGFDLKEFRNTDPDHQRALADSSTRYHKRIIEFPKPVVTGIQGPAMAGGFDLAVMCDIRIATPQAVFKHPEISFAPVLFNPLREIIGGGMARDLSLTGRQIDAAEAHRIGLVSEIVEPDQLRETCAARAAQVAAAPIGPLRAVKKMIVDSYGGWDDERTGGGLFITS